MRYSLSTRLGILFILLMIPYWGYCGEAGLIAAWDFDETTGSLVRDVTGHGHDGQISGGGAVRRVPGVRGHALAFPGDKSAYVACENPGSLNLRDALTIEAWIQRTDSGSFWDGLICNGGSKQGFQLFYCERSQSLVCYINTDEQGYGAINGGYVPLDEWMHVAMTFDATSQTIQLFQNGRATASQRWKGRLTDFPAELFLGRSLGFQAFRGMMDEVKIYSRALTPKEIAAHYESLASRLLAPAPAPLQCFADLKAQLSDGKPVLSFKKTADFAASPSGCTTETMLYIVRGEHIKSDVTPGVRSGKTIFKGKLSASANHTFKFTDPIPIQSGRSYYYWVSPDFVNFRNAPARVRVYHPSVWWSPSKIESKIQEITKNHPNAVRVKTYGKTVQGRPLNALLIGNSQRCIMLVGAMHVSESGPELILGALEGILKENPGLLDQVGIAALPCVTLDERERFLSTGYPLYLRKNSRGIDLNRNFDGFWDIVSMKYGQRSDDPKSETYRGPQPVSEPETQAVLALAGEANPVAIFSFHSIGSLCNAAFLYCQFADSQKNEEYIHMAKKVSRAYAEGMYPGEADKYYTIEGATTQGGLPAWAYQRLGIPAFDLELDRHPGPRAVVYSDAVSESLMEEYQKRHQRGIENLIREILSNRIVLSPASHK